jgi:outer membrane protein assembly factor BamB
MGTRWLLLGTAIGVCCATGGADDWPQFRGPTRDNKVTGFKAPQTWPKALKQQWKVPVGDGVASPVLVGDKVYTFTRQGGDEVILCLNADTGKEVWNVKYAADPVTGAAVGGKAGGEKYTGPRASPAVANGKVCTYGVAGMIMCVDAATGKEIWKKDTKAKPRFYTSCSPVGVDGHFVVQVGTEGKGQVIAYDTANGAEKWKCPTDGPSYGSPVPASIGGTKQVILLTDQSLVGVGLADGKELWKVGLKVGRYPTGTPVVDGNVVICSGSAFTIEKSGDAFSAKPYWKEQAPATYNTPVLKGGVLYGLMAGSGKGTTKLYCQDAKTGKVLWEDTASRGECGAVLDAGSVLLALSSDSNLIAFKPDAAEYAELAKYKVADTPTWAMPIVTGNRIYVKDRDSLYLWTIE